MPDVDLHGVRAGRETAELDPGGHVAALLDELRAAALVIRALEPCVREAAFGVLTLMSPQEITVASPPVGPAWTSM